MFGRWLYCLMVLFRYNIVLNKRFLFSGNIDFVKSYTIFQKNAFQKRIYLIMKIEKVFLQLTAYIHFQLFKICDKVFVRWMKKPWTPFFRKICFHKFSFYGSQVMEVLLVAHRLEFFYMYGSCFKQKEQEIIVLQLYKKFGIQTSLHFYNKKKNTVKLHFNRGTIQGLIEL